MCSPSASTARNEYSLDMDFTLLLLVLSPARPREEVLFVYWWTIPDDYQGIRITLVIEVGDYQGIRITLVIEVGDYQGIRITPVIEVGDYQAILWYSNLFGCKRQSPARHQPKPQQTHRTDQCPFTPPAVPSLQWTAMGSGHLPNLLADEVPCAAQRSLWYYRTNQLQPSTGNELHQCMVSCVRYLCNNQLPHQ
ncbi:hypothetical protein RRG08_017739 [Elysia crispata]|uniref:Uncharacterized protein n=1 Tax=Elysia crispata TaxID=231223 RepID=A0AAE0XRE0_9GAST|nr:hypothetical protein RRG08_017739 [Elysia crispata]